MRWSFQVEIRVMEPYYQKLRSGSGIKSSFSLIHYLSSYWRRLFWFGGGTYWHVFTQKYTKIIPFLILVLLGLSLTRSTMLWSFQIDIKVMDPYNRKLRSGSGLKIYQAFLSILIELKLNIILLTILRFNFHRIGGGFFVWRHVFTKKKHPYYTLLNLSFAGY